MVKDKMSHQANLLFEEAQEPVQPGAEKAFSPQEIHHGEIHAQRDVAEAERVLLHLADYIYAHTSLKPMSKTLFFISRCLLLARKGIPVNSARQAIKSYNDLCRSLGCHSPTDDFDFSAVIREVEPHLDRVNTAIEKVATIGTQTDTLGLVFNTLLRGKFEGGEGLGTYLTPEEVAVPMVDMGVAALDSSVLARFIGVDAIHFGDICGGTGRFAYAIYRALVAKGASREAISRAARLYDQSSLAVGLAKLNFLFDDILPDFETVSDSVTSDTVSSLRGSFGLLATNPPFGVGKYRWNPGLGETVPSELLKAIGLTKEEAADPSHLFVFRNLDLLMPGGVLVIVLPDGLLQSREFAESLRVYEQCRLTKIEVVAVVSLPAVTFSLGGTVAKTSFVVFRRATTNRKVATYLGRAQHVGFVKRGNRRSADPRGNDLLQICREFAAQMGTFGQFGRDWHDAERLTFGHLRQQSDSSNSGILLSQLVSPVRESVRVPQDSTNHFHVSILDVDNTGLIDVLGAAHNRPVTPGLKCKPGDILVSCINPRIWRTAIIPDISGDWSCSSEFIVVRPKDKDLSWAISLALHHQSVIEAVQNLTGGTSSSRQRVEKQRILELVVPLLEQFRQIGQKHKKDRVEVYATRLREMQLYDALHSAEKPQY